MSEKSKRRWQRTYGRGVAVLASLVLAACGEDAPTEVVEFQDPETVSFAPALGVDLSAMTKSTSGLYWTDLEEGVGDPVQDGEILSLAYTGWLADGTMFDTNRTAGGVALVVQLGVTGLIPGFEEGLAGIKEGGQRLLVIPPELGYGAQAFPGIPAGSVLVFEVEVLEILEG